MDYGKFIHTMNSETGGAFLFIGEEKFLIDDLIERILAKFVAKGTFDFNYIVMDGEKSDIDKLVNAVETLPFMSEKRLVVMNDVQAFFENCKPDDDFIDYLLKVHRECLLILVERDKKIAKNTKAYKKFKAADRAVEFNKLNGAELSSWIKHWLLSAKKRMSRTTEAYFVSQIGYFSKNLNTTLNDVKNEIDKLINISSEEVITEDDVDRSLVKYVDANIFKLTDSLIEADCASALKELNKLYISGQNEMGILSMIIRQQRLMLMIRNFKKRGLGDGAIRERTGIKQFEYGKLVRGRFSEPKLRENLRILAETDKRLKSTGTDSNIALEFLIIKLCSGV